jgi:hypothetical protein
MPRFVVLEHHWNGVHWDLMLERGDGLRTWAIDAPIAAGIDLPARALGDHRSRYLDYEGAISGNRGEVRRLDRGLYTARLWTADRIRIELHGAQLWGPAELRRSGAGAIETPFSWIFRLGNFS